MPYEKIPLKEQLDRAYKDYRIHPEYEACAALAFGRMPLADYMKEHTPELGMALGLPPGRLEKMTVREAAALISRKKRAGQGMYPHPELLRLFAAPMADAYQAWKKAWEEAGQNGRKEET